jgi:hypothetical protein
MERKNKMILCGWIKLISVTWHKIHSGENKLRKKFDKKEKKSLNFFGKKIEWEWNSCRCFVCFSVSVKKLIRYQKINRRRNRKKASQETGGERERKIILRRVRSIETRASVRGSENGGLQVYGSNLSNR